MTYSRVISQTPLLRWANSLSISLILLLSFTNLNAQRIGLVAGGPGDGRLATEADLEPTRIAVGADGTVYLITRSYNTIRKIDPATGIVSRIAGTGAFGNNFDGGNALNGALNLLSNLTIGPDGNIYFIENAAVRKIDDVGNLVTVAGNITQFGFSGDGGLATQAKFSSPSDCAFDSDGNLYIADLGNLRIRKVNAITGVVTTIAGSGSSAFSGDGGPAVDAGMWPNNIALDGNGNLFFSDTHNQRIRKVNLSTGIVDAVAGDGNFGSGGDGGLGTSAQVNSPIGMTVHSDILYFADQQNSRVRQIILSTGIISTVAGSTSGFSGDGGPATSAMLYLPSSIAFDGSGNLFICDYGGKRIRKVTGTTITTIGGTGGFFGDDGPANLATLNSPNGIIRVPNGDLYFTDELNNRIRKIDHSTGIITTIAGTGEQGHSGDGGLATSAMVFWPLGIAMDGSGNIVFGEYANSRIRRIDASTGFISTIAGNGQFGDSGEGGPAITAEFGGPTGIAIDGNGNIFFADVSNNKVKRIDHTTNNITTIAGVGTPGFSGDGGPATGAELNTPSGLAFDPDGSLYIADNGNSRIRKINLSGDISTFAGNGNIATAPDPVDGQLALDASIIFPNALGFDSQGNMFVGTAYHLIRAEKNTGKINIVAGVAAGGYSGDGGPATESTVRYPSGVVVDPDGNVFFTDAETNVIRKISVRTLTQTISFSALPDHTLGEAPFAIPPADEFSSAGLPIVFSSSNLAIATISGNIVTLRGAGTVDITASQPGNVDYLPAASVVQSLVVNKGMPVVAFTSPDHGPADTSIDLDVDEGGSTGIVTYTKANGTGAASLSGSVLKLKSNGTVTLTASVAEDANYKSAAAQQTVTITNPLAIINFTSTLNGSAGTSVSITVDQGASTGALTLTEQNISGSATLSGSDLSLTSPGLIRITASIAGDAHFGPATLTQIFTINNSDGTAFQAAAKIFGTTLQGGASNAGVLYQMDADLNGLTLLKQFSSDPSGSSPKFTKLIRAADGKFYGVLGSGGLYNAGVIFRFDPADGTYATLYPFSEEGGAGPTGRLIEASDGKFYGLTGSGGDFNSGVLYQYDYINNVFTKKISFDAGTQQYTSLIEVSGTLYGVTANGGANGYGTLFSYVLSNGAFSDLFDFDNTTGSQPNGELIQASNGKLYGITTGGGAIGSGTLFEYDIAHSTFTKKVDMAIFDTGGFTIGGLVLAPNGKLYALLAFGGNNFYGTIIEYDPGTTACLKKYDFTLSDGTNPYGSLVLNTNGKLYGLGSSGGTTGQGSLFEYAPGATTITKKFDFDGLNGSSPLGSLATSSDGKMYGMTAGGGLNGAGTLFEFDPANSALMKKKDFIYAPEGAEPANPLAFASNKLFGTAIGGATNLGVFYEYDLGTGTYAKRLDLTKASGNFGIGAIAHPNGKIYVLTSSAGPSPDSNGAIVEYNPATGLSDVVHIFDGTINGSNPASITYSKNGKIYGVAGGGLTHGGVLFEFEPTSGTYAKKVDFDYSTSGQFPLSVVEGPDGMLYGLTQYGGSAGGGTIFKYDPHLSQFTKLRDFSGADGSLPSGKIAFGQDSKFYGITSNGGQSNRGILYEFDVKSMTLVKKQDLDGNQANGGLTTGPDGKILGCFYIGGSANKGGVFEYDPASNQITTKINFTGPNGSIPNANLLVLKNDQSIAFNPIPAKSVLETPFDLTATATSGLAISFTSSDPSVATATGNTVTIVGIGQTWITATQAGNQNFNPAANAVRLLTITKSSQTIAFESIPAKTLGDVPFILTASASSGLTVAFSTPSDRISIASASVTLIKGGRASIKAEQAGDSTYDSAAHVVRSFCINPAKPGITMLTTLQWFLISSNASGNQWYRDGMAISGATEDSFRATTSGAYTVQTTIDDCASVLSEPVNVITTGFNEDLTVDLYPNPVRDEMVIDLGGITQTKTVVVMTDMLGRTIESREVEDGMHIFDVRSLSGGMYIVKIEGKRGVITRAFVKTE